MEGLCRIAELLPIEGVLSEGLRGSLIIMAEKENKTKNFVLRIDADTLAAIEKWAADEFRSTNGQLQWIIAEALKKHGRAKNTKRGLPLSPSQGGGTPENDE